MAEIRNPATGEPIATVAVASPADVAAAGQRARTAQPGWAALPVAERARTIRAAGRWVAAHTDDIVRVVSECTGKPPIDALSSEVLPAVIMCDYYARSARRFLRPRRVRRSSVLFVTSRRTLHLEPYGLVGIISPWNYPLGIPMHEVVTALLCGNAVILKVATQVQPVGEAIARIFREVGLPDGLLSVVHVPGAIATEALLDAGVAKIFFTGSTEVGRSLAAKAAARLVPVSLELGGNDPMIVRADADLVRAVGGAVWAGLSNAGQSCGAVERIYVHASIYDEFLTLLSERVRGLHVGGSMDRDVGSLTTAAQRTTVEEQLRDAIDRGGVIVARSEAAPSGAGLYHEAVVVEVTDDSSALMRDETFGPLLAVRRVENDAEALRLANDSPYGLTASIWTRDNRTARSMAAALEAGTVTINDHLSSHGMPETPWGGYKESGIGRSHGELGFHEMTQPKIVVEARFRSIRANMWWQPYSQEAYDGVLGALLARYGSGLHGRVRGLLRAARLFVRRMKG